MSEITMATVDDARAVTRLQLDFDAEFDPTLDTSQGAFDALLGRFRRLIADPAAFVLVAGPIAEPVGHAVVTLRPTIYGDGPLAVLDELYVIPTVRGGGVGGRLLTAATDEVRRRGGEWMHINVDEPDADARRFYERHGFTNVDADGGRFLMYERMLVE